MLKTSLLILLAITTLGLSPVIAGDSPQKAKISILGRVTDVKGEPILGASVVLVSADQIVAATPTDAGGIFRLDTHPECFVSPILRVSSISHDIFELGLDTARSSGSDNATTLSGGASGDQSTLVLDIILTNRIYEIGAIEVRPSSVSAPSEEVIGSAEIAHAARQSLVPTNLASAIKSPEVSRQGSQHSSQIRINGTSPLYYLNGLSIGYDPDHYGMFTIIPASAVQQIKLHPQGTDVSFALPSSIELKTPEPFGESSRAEFSLSVTDATGLYSYGTRSFFTLVTVRKSVLDKIVKGFDIDSGRRTLPPTNFQDLFLSSGLKLSPHFRLMIDQYYVRDFLSYNTLEAGVSGENVDTRQKTDENMIALRLDGLYDKSLFTASLAARKKYREYVVAPQDANPDQSLRLNLRQQLTTVLANVEARFVSGNTEIMFGNQLEYTLARDVNMMQRNWNFLPPFANTDKPFIYQQALNDTYATFAVNDTETDNATYFSLAHRFGPVTVENGIRHDYFSMLATTTHLAFRNKLTVQTGEDGVLELYHGTFAENPVNNILEPYQVLILSNLERLEPVKQQLVSLGYRKRGFETTLFAKRFSNLPVMSPDFDRVYDQDGSFCDDFISMASIGKAEFVGATVSLDLNEFISRRLDVRLSYAHTYARKVDHGVDIPHDLNAPHRLMGGLTFRVSDRLTLGGELNWRSGYPYTPTNAADYQPGQDIYTPEYYRSALDYENSGQFPNNGVLSLNGSYHMNSTEFFFSVSNVTNRGNPIINTTDGYVYDAGILPNIGFRWSF